jgi:hypothetical protein
VRQGTWQETGGGGIVLLIALALIASHGSGLSGAVTAVLIGLVVLVVLAILGVLGCLVYRATRPPQAGISMPRAALRAEVLPPDRQMLAAPVVRLPADQLEQLAEILRRGQRPEQARERKRS